MSDVRRAATAAVLSAAICAVVSFVMVDIKSSNFTDHGADRRSPSPQPAVPSHVRPISHRQIETRLLANHERHPLKAPLPVVFPLRFSGPQSHRDRIIRDVAVVN